MNVETPSVDRASAAFDLKTIISAERKPRILAVDDQRDALRLLQIRLQNAGFECLTAADGAAALAALEKDLVDVIILDVMMPGMDGFEVCRRLKLAERTRDIPVIFLTAKFEMEDKVRGLEVGGHDYLSKPVEQPELLARTKSALRVKQLQDQLKERIQLQQTINQLHQGMLGEHWQKTLGQLAASLAHEINNPLAAALGSAQLLAMDEQLDQNTLDRLQIIDRSLQRAGQKLRSLLLIAQNSRHAQTISVGQMVEDLATMVNFQIVVNKVALQTDFDESAEWQGVSSELARAILYVINNAIEAVTGVQNPTITLRVLAGTPHTQIQVIDNGPGIPVELRERVFEPFFTTKGPPHNGVGLHLANKIIQNIGGKVELQTPASGQGAQIVIFLPAAEG
jgi:DNA-binding response OmpR family regulator/anti-sigma regulatory factor (Ser/Thr protein kinase)